MAASRKPQQILTAKELKESKNNYLKNLKEVKEIKEQKDPQLILGKDIHSGEQQLIADMHRGLQIANKDYRTKESKYTEDVMEKLKAELPKIKAEMKAQGVSDEKINLFISSHSQGPGGLVGSAVTLFAPQEIPTEEERQKAEATQSKDFSYVIRAPKIIGVDLIGNVYVDKGDIYLKSTLMKFAIEKMPIAMSLDNSSAGTVIGPIEAVFKVGKVGDKEGFILQHIATDNNIVADMIMGNIASKDQLTKALNEKQIAANNTALSKLAQEVHAKKTSLKKELLNVNAKLNETPGKVNVKLTQESKDVSQKLANMVRVSDALNQFAANKINIIQLKGIVAEAKQAMSSVRTNKRLSKLLDRSKSTRKLIKELEAELSKLVFLLPTTQLAAPQAELTAESKAESKKEASPEKPSAGGLFAQTAKDTKDASPAAPTTAPAPKQPGPGQS